MTSILRVTDLRPAGLEASGPAVQDLSFEAKAGEAVALTGPRGAGPSAVIRILAGLLREYGGTVHFHGKELHDWGREFFERIGLALETPMVAGSLTARENLAWAGGFYGGDLEPIPDLLERMGLAKEADIRADRLGPGALWRLSLARAVLHKPEALFLELPAVPGSGKEGNLLKDLIEGHKRRGGLAVLASEEPAQVEAICDRVLDLPARRITA